jgi:2-polyprenyl-3-methyl-5-hydroxy-6-metoxy-1,4-benzoquinol methylase
VSSLIRATGRDRYFAQRERELEALVDPGTGMLAERYGRTIACPLCAMPPDEHERLFVKRGFTFVRCRACALVFSNPQVDESLVLEEYRAGRSNDLWVDVLTSERQLELDRGKFARILDGLEPFRGDGRILDVGCSIGLFLRLAVDRGWDGRGIEFGERALAYAREHFAVEVTETPLAEAGFAPASFDVVTVLSVLEHTTDPRALLRDVAQVLKVGGALHLIVPNVESLACRVLHERAATFDGRNHLVYFAPRTLTDMLAREGFEARSTVTTVSSLDPVLEWLAYREPYADADLAADPLARAVNERRGEIERLLEQLGLGYKLHCLAVKTSG